MFYVYLTKGSPPVPDVLFFAFQVTGDNPVLSRGKDWVRFGSVSDNNCESSHRCPQILFHLWLSFSFLNFRNHRIDVLIEGAGRLEPPA